MIRYGQTWWGRKWLNALANIDWQNRLPRGRAYARGGAVKKIEIDGNRIDADVLGRKRYPYKIKIEVPRFTKQEKACLVDEITKNTLMLTRLLNRNLPDELYDIAESTGIKIFPESWGDLRMSCSCPDWAVPCKHIAAVIYILANEIDKNPFIVFQLHGFDIIHALKNRNLSVDTISKQRMMTVDDITVLETIVSPDFSFDEKEFEKIDYSVIPDIRESVFELLSSSSLFFERDFKPILNGVYKKIARSASQYGPRKSSDLERAFDYEKITSVFIILDQNFDVKNVSISAEKEDGPSKLETEFRFLFSLLNRIEPKKLPALCPSLVSLYSLFSFTLKIMEKGAFIPQLLYLGQEKYRIRWIPAVMNDKVKTVFDQLTALIPTGIIRFQYTIENDTKQKTCYQKPDEQITSIVALLIEIFFEEFDLFEDLRWKYASSKIAHKVLELFFQNWPVSFEAFEEKEIPKTIQIWLNKLHMTFRAFVPMIKVDAEENNFLLDLFVENKREDLKEPVPLSRFLLDKKYREEKFEVLRDLSLLSDHFSKLEEVIKTEGKEKLVFNSSEFAEVLLHILPVIGMFGINILMPRELRSLIRPQLSLYIENRKAGDSVSSLDLDSMLSFDWKVAIGDELIQASKFREMVKEMSGIVKIRDQFVLIDQKDIERLFNNLSKPGAMNSDELLRTALTGEYKNAKIGLSKEVNQLIESLIKIERIDIPKAMKATLRPYQVRGYEWMVKNAKLGFGSLIADDMGLGKTLQVLAALLKFKQDGYFKNKKVLIIVPTTLITNWLKEIEKFTPGLKPFVYHGLKRRFEPRNNDLVITTYGIVRSETKKFQKQDWHTIVIDEAQNIKNPQTGQTKSIKKLKSDIKIAMSGTPVENRLSEYWSIMDFTNEGYLGSLKKFNEEFSRPIQLYHDQDKIEMFRKMTEPFILRRLKSDKRIIQDLPEKIENNQYCSLTSKQAAVYQNVVENSMVEIESQEGIARKGLVFKLMTALKQICNHPYHFLKRGEMDAELSGKTTLLFSILDNIYDNNEKVLIFTQYREMGDLLVHFIEKRYSSRPLFLHGGTNRQKRDQMVDNFQNEKHIRTFILSLKAGGTGLNLTAATNVIHYDLWWNPAVENQATDRTYRIGQTQKVMVFRLLTRGTFEEKIEEMLQSKKVLAELTVSSGEKWIGELSNNELRELVNLS